MPFSSLWRRAGKKTSIKPFKPELETVAESAPSSPRRAVYENAGLVNAKRPASVDMLCSPKTETQPASSEPFDEFPTHQPIESDRDNGEDFVADLKSDRDNGEDLVADLKLQLSTPSPVRREVGARPLSPAPASSSSASPASPLLKCDPSSKFCLDKSLSEVILSVEAEFGPTIGTSLRSSKWDRRVQALKAVGTVMKGLDLGGSFGKPSNGALKGLRLRDRVSCWRTSCLVLHHAMRDKVMPVRLASYELFHDVFSNSQGVVTEEEVRATVGALLGHLIDRLGDSNLRLHENARKCLVFCAELPGLLGLREVLIRLHSHLESAGKSRDRTKVHFGILDAVNVLLQRFPRGHSLVESTPRLCWTQQDVMPFVIAGMDDALGPRVRNSAVLLAVLLRATFGSQAVEPVLANLRPGVRAVLLDRFAELDGKEDTNDDSEGEMEDFEAPSADTMSGLFIQGSAIKGLSRQCVMSLPGTVADDDDGVDDDCLMDNILEDTGMVFNGTGTSAMGGSLVASRVKRGAMPQEDSDIQHGLSCLDCLNDEDLRQLGFDPEDLGCSQSPFQKEHSVHFNSAIEVF